MSTIHELLLVLHSFTRWWVLLACLSLLPYALAGWLRRRAFVARDERLLRLLVSSVDLQVLLGLSLYFAFSPLARAARALWAARGFRVRRAAQPRRRLRQGVAGDGLGVSARRGPESRWGLAIGVPRRQLKPRKNAGHCRSEAAPG